MPLSGCLYQLTPIYCVVYSQPTTPRIGWAAPSLLHSRRHSLSCPCFPASSQRSGARTAQVVPFVLAVWYAVLKRSTVHASGHARAEATPCSGSAIDRFCSVANGSRFLQAYSAAFTQQVSGRGLFHVSNTFGRCMQDGQPRTDQTAPQPRPVARRRQFKFECQY